MAGMGISKTPKSVTASKSEEDLVTPKKEKNLPAKTASGASHIKNLAEGDACSRARGGTCARPTAFTVRYACHRDSDRRTRGTAPCCRLRAVPRPCGTAGACAPRACWIDPGAARATTTRCIGSSRGTEPPSNVHSGGNGHRFSSLSQRFQHGDYRCAEPLEYTVVTLQNLPLMQLVSSYLRYVSTSHSTKR